MKIYKNKFYPESFFFFYEKIIRKLRFNIYAFEKSYNTNFQIRFSQKLIFP